MHLNKGKTLAQCLTDRTEYGMNPDKTDGGELISSFACEPETVVSEFALSKREYRELTGRVQALTLIAYQIRHENQKQSILADHSVKDIPNRNYARFSREAKHTIPLSRRKLS